MAPKLRYCGRWNLIPPKDGNPLAWGLVLSIVTACLVFLQQFFPVDHKPFTEPAAAIGAAFGWGAIMCLIVDNVRHWMWRRSNSPRRSR
jgi:hypothetical protein